MIITTTSTNSIDSPFLSAFPSQFETEKFKTTDHDYIKGTMDYYSAKGQAEYLKNKRTFAKNYNLLKGKLDKSDYLESPKTDLFVQALTKDLELPSYVKHYPILNPPLNEMLGGLSKKRNTFRSKALDHQSKSEEAEARTHIMWSLIMQQAQADIMQQIGPNVPKDPKAQKQIQEMIQQRAQDDLIDYTSMAERWANHVMEAMRTELNLNEISEEMLRDLLICSRPFALIDEDNSKRGFKVEVINPKNVLRFHAPNKKYSKDDFADVIVNVMEISEIMETFDLTKEEIDHLKKAFDQYSLPSTIETNYGTNNTGIAGINYHTYSPLLLQEREIIAAEMEGDTDEDALINDILNISEASPAIFGYKYVVVRAYWCSKKLIKKVTFIDEEGIERTVFADENYKNGSIPTELSVEEGWINQWYKGYKIGNDVYSIKPFNLLPHSPLIGGTFDEKNSEATSLLDLMKPFQVLYNVLINQAYSILGKDKGKVLKINLRKIPIPKEGDPEDAVDILLEDAKERGLILEDDSPENAKAPLQNTQITNAVDLDLSQQLQTRLALAQAIKLECWELVGFTRQRLASATPGETATANQNALNISYTQTEPYYIQHRYVMGQLYQAIVDVAQYIESQKPLSTLSYLNDKGESAFIQVTGPEIRNRDIGVYVTSSAEDDRIFKELQSLSQAVLQNDGTLYDVSQLYTTNSLRKLEQVLKTLSDKRNELQQQQLQNEQDGLKAKQAEAAAKIQATQIEEDKTRQFEAWQNELDRLNKKEIALIQAYGRNDNALADNNNNGTADALELTKQQAQVAQANKDHTIKQRETDIKEKARQDALLIELQKLAVEREKIQAQLKMKKMDLANPVPGETKPKKRK